MRRLKPASELLDLARAKLASSGIDEELAKLLKVEILDKEAMQKLGPEFQPRGGIKLPYFDLKGKPTKFFRVRYIEDPIGFAAAASKQLRYMQPKGTVNEVYAPPLLDWKQMIEEQQQLFITEGELKAACACAQGIPTLGLGGVDTWRAKKRGIKLLPMLAEISWEGREVVIVFDSDAASNPDVARAQRQLAEELTERAAQVSMLALPAKLDGSKQGLDDYLMSHDEDEWIQLLGTKHAFSAGRALWELNDAVVLVRDPGLLIDQRRCTKISAQNFVKVHYANKKHLEPNAKGELRQVSTAQKWLEWPARNEVEKIVFEPGKDPVYLEEGRRYWNAWKGWGCEPRKGDMTWWKDIVHGKMFKGHPREVRWLEQWLAYPLQHPGTKLLTAVILWGREQGQGKSFIGAMMQKIYGVHSLELKAEAVHANFNGWVENRQFIQGEEVTNRDRRSDAEFFKNLVTQQTVLVNAKFVPQYTIRDCVNWFFTSNHPDSFFLDEADRRFFVYEVKTAKADVSAETWLDWDRRKHDLSGPSALFHYLLSLDLSDFNPNAEAMSTAAKLDMVALSQSDLSAWCLQLREDPEHVLANTALPASCDIFTPKQLCIAYDPQERRNIGSPGMGRALKTARIDPLQRGPIRTASGIHRLYAVRNRDRWMQAKTAEIAAHFDTHFPGSSAPKKHEG